MEDYIYILLIIVWIVFSLIKGIQKNKKTQPSVSQKSKSPTQQGIERWLEEMLPDDLKPQSSDPLFSSPEAEPVVFSQEEESEPERLDFGRFSNDYKSFRNVVLEDIDEMSAMQYSMKESEQIETEEVGSQRYVPLDFSLRKAMIYQVILERPYQ